jgi:hypothetical protein
LEELKVHMWIRTWFSWGVRRSSDSDQASSALGASDESDEGILTYLKSNWKPGFRTIHIHGTEEENRAAAKLRRDTTGELPKPLAILVKESGE